MSARKLPIPNLQDADGKPVAGAGKGNTRAMTHGFRALAEIDRNPRTAAIAEWIESVLPVVDAADAPAIWLLAGCMERRIRGLAALESAKSVKETAILRRDLSTVENTIGRLLDQLAMTPTSRAKLGLDLSRTGEALREHLDATYGGGE